MQIKKNRCVVERQRSFRLCFVLMMLWIGLFYPNNLQAGTSGSIFEQFPWLITSNGIDPAACESGNCSVEKIEVYGVGIHRYLLITDANRDAKLYYQDGQFYCQNAANYDCVAAYGFDPPIDSWVASTNPISACVADDERIRSLRSGVPTSACEDAFQITQIDYKGSTYFETEVRRNSNPIFPPCPSIEFGSNVRDCAGTEICRSALGAPPPLNPEVCSAVRSGEGIQRVIWTRDEGRVCTVDDPFSLRPIQEAINRGPLIDPIIGSICFPIEEIVQLEYNNSTYFRINERSCPPFEFGDRFYNCEGNFVGGTGFQPDCQPPSLCGELNRATSSGTVIWSFEDEQLPSNNQLFTEYLWLIDLVNPDHCTTENVTAYQAGIYPYLLVTAASGDTKLYNQNGLFYCQQSANNDCVDLYSLGDPVDTWACGTSSH